ncbi:MAG: YbjN domain-containing protein [Clostridia bacterium]|jgi:hypothetical protein|nr:YbjN domain-containing protein [Clostridia bacterium]
MAFKATQIISDLFTLREIRHNIQEPNERISLVRAGFTGDNACGVDVDFVNTDNDNDVSVRVNNLLNLKVPEEKQLAVLEELNRLNNKYRYVKFCLRDNNTISVEYDLGVETSEAKLGMICREMFIRFMNIIDEAVGSIAEAIING